MPAVEVAQGLVEAMEKDIFEINIGQTADFRKFYLSAPADALK